MSREKQMEEMADIIYSKINGANFDDVSDAVVALYDAGYRKQIEGEWIKDNTSKFEHRYNCSVCNYRFFGIPTNYCPNCGAKIKGGITRE